GQLAVETVGPNMRAGLGVDELGVEAHAVTGFAYAAFERVAHAELAADCLHVRRLALVGECGVARDHEGARYARQFGSEILGQAIDEIFLLGVARHVGERQHDDGKTGRGLYIRPRFSGDDDRILQRINPHRTRDVFERFFADVDERCVDLVAHLAPGVFGKTDAARLANPFETRRDVDAVTHEVAVAFHQHVAQMDADTQQDLALRGDAFGACSHFALHGDARADRVDHARKFDQHAVAGAL